jgi:glycine oxidase
LSRASIAVVGAGVFGLAIALRLAQGGAQVVLHDPGEPEDSASGVAAGMLAPALESVMDPTSRRHFALLSDARDRWPSLLDAAGGDASLLDRSGALFVSESIDEIAGRLSRLGARAERLGQRQARMLIPGLAGQPAEYLFLADEWRVAPLATLAALSSAFARAGGRRERGRLTARNGVLGLDEGSPLRADRVVIAAGAEASALAGAIPELSVLTPIKGQILHYRGGPSDGPIVRTPSAYVSPQPGGAAVGATMEPGLADRRTDPIVLARLRAEAERLFPGMTGLEAEGRAGVRASTPDGLPLVGIGAGDGRVVMAVGARRNGWLLAPLVAEMVEAIIRGDDPGPFAADLAAARFSA